MIINHIIDDTGIEKPIKSVERDIAVSLIRYFRRMVFDYADSPDQEPRKKSIEFATNLIDGKADKLQELMQFVRKESRDYLPHVDGRCRECNYLSQNQIETDLTEQEIRQIDINNNKFNDRMRLLSNATDRQYLKAFDIAIPYLEKLLMRCKST